MDFYEKQLFNSKIFNDDVIDALDEIIYDYFRYKSYDEIEKTEQLLDEKYEVFEKDDDMELDEVTDSDLFD